MLRHGLNKTDITAHFSQESCSETLVLILVDVQVLRR